MLSFDLGNGNETQATIVHFSSMLCMHNAFDIEQRNVRNDGEKRNTTGSTKANFYSKLFRQTMDSAEKKKKKKQVMQRQRPSGVHCVTN